MESAPTISAPETVSANLRMILCGVLAALGAWRVEAALALVLYRRINRTLGRIERMLARFRAGRLWRVTHRVTAPGRQMCREPAAQLPRRFGWLVRMGGYQAAGFGAQLQAVMNTPDMTELLAASAQARLVLQPLCRALAVELPGGISTAGAEPGETARRRSCPRAQPEPFRIPLPRGVLLAARRAGFGKDH